MPIRPPLWAIQQFDLRLETRYPNRRSSHFGACNYDNQITRNRSDTIVSVLSMVNRSRNTILSLLALFQNDIQKFDVLHLTDTHVSTDYAVGSSHDCVDDLCCTDRVRGIATRATAVGPYGDIRGKSMCDIPARTLKSLLTDARQRTVCGGSRCCVKAIQPYIGSSRGQVCR